MPTLIFTGNFPPFFLHIALNSIIMPLTRNAQIKENLITLIIARSRLYRRVYLESLVLRSELALPVQSISTNYSQVRKGEGEGEGEWC